jgi:hypothetical protein
MSRLATRCRQGLVFYAIIVGSALPIEAHVIDQSIVINTPIGSDTDGFVIQSDGATSPIVQIMDGGALVSASGVLVTDDSKLVFRWRFSW